MLLPILGVRSTFRNIYICSQFCGWSGQRKVGGGLPSQHSHETLLKAQGVASHLRQPGDPHSEEARQTFSGKQPNSTSPEATPPPGQPHSWPSTGLGAASTTPRSEAMVAHWADKMGPQDAPWAPGRRKPFLSTPSLGDCRLESQKMVFTTQLAAINYSRPRFPQTHRLSLLAR